MEKFETYAPESAQPRLPDFLDHVEAIPEATKADLLQAIRLTGSQDKLHDETVQQHIAQLSTEQ